ncbi:laminin EGF-like protein [Ancylostoma duodenale]|uniref:Laminin EGF-like protein n=1 Tax=Ancylostoma duodenale TaxID=51022 RepID=A0A0C2D1A2_9BILA|nr:laminin EGF-like protein [Ancylostoma duodenale]
MFGGVIDRRNITSELWSFDIHSREWKKEGGDNTDLMVPPLSVAGHTAHVIGSEMYIFFGYHPEIGFVHNVQKLEGGVLGTQRIRCWTINPAMIQDQPASFWGAAVPTHCYMGGNGYNISESRTKQECFSAMVQAYDIACKQWFNISTGASQLRRYGHTAVATNSELYILGGFNGRMLNDVWRLTPAECSSATRPEECRSLADGVKCVFADRACVKFDPFVSYKQSFLSFVKNESPKSMSECRNTALRQALQVCDEQNDCMSCISEPGCGWCPSGDQCLPNDGECVDGQVMLTTWEKCSLTRDPPPPRPCGMANDCRSCKLLAHCNWYTVEGKPTCIPLEDEILLRKEQLDRELDRVASSSLPLRLPTTPPPIPPGQNLSYCPLPCSSLYTCTQCLQEQKCMWCPSTNRVSLVLGQSSNCSAHKTCAECQLSPECGWLDDGSHTGLGNCTQGSAQGPLNPDKNFRPEQWYFIDCPACQCNGHSMCNETRHTLGGIQEVCGECQDNTMGKHCELCAPGYFGDPRNGDHCKPCQCNGQADTCDNFTGACHCRTKGVTGNECDRCEQKYYGQPRNGTPCYYELSVDFIFTFKLKNEDKDKHATEIYLFSIPHKKDTDVTFQISCDGGSQANVALNITSSLFESTPRKMMHNTTCDSKGFRRVYVASDPDYAYGTDANTTFFVRVFNFTTPITIQVSFAQSPPINWVLFFVIFAACFIVLLVVAGLLWMIKLRIEVYRRNQRRIDEIEHMASRPFSSIKLELTNPHCFTAAGPVQGPTPLSVEPCSNYKSGIFTLAVRLPTGGRATTPNGTSGLAVASALCQLTPAQLGVLQAPDNSENRNNRKTTLRRYIPFLRARENDAEPGLRRQQIFCSNNRQNTSMLEKIDSVVALVQNRAMTSYA